MYPCSFDESNEALGRPHTMSDDECMPLSICRTATESGNPVLVSCWKLTQEELDEINRTGRVWLTVLGATMPPVAVDGIKPFAGG